MQKRNVIFLGTSAFALPSLAMLLENKTIHVAHIITQPDKPVGRKQILTASPIKEYAEKHGRSVLQPEKMNIWFKEASSLPRPDYLIVVSYGQILSNDVLNWPKIAAINVHASLLPLLRGASPIQSAILQNMQETGVTVQRMVQELDAGPILKQTSVRIEERETAETLHDKLATLGASTLLHVLNHPHEERLQDETKATFCKKLEKNDGLIDYQALTAEEIDRRVRALSPWPGITTKNGTKIIKTSLTETHDALPLLCNQNTTLFLECLQPAGKTPMSGMAFHRGYQLSSL